MGRRSPGNLIIIGKVVRPHGLQGLLRVWSYAQRENSFLHSETIFLRSTRQETLEFKVISVKPHKNLFLIKLEGLDSIEEAEKYRGSDILIEKDSLKHENDDEYFWFELIGLDVYLDSGELLGTLKDIISTGSNDIYVVRNEKKEFLIPAISEVVQEIDLENKKLVITDMEGLLDLNEV